MVQDPGATMPAAFVSFKSRWGAAVCAQTQQNQDPTLWLTDWAPEPRDVYWENLSIPYVQLGFRRLAAGHSNVFACILLYDSRSNCAIFSESGGAAKIDSCT